MKNLLTVSLAIVVLAVFTGTGAAQQKGVEKSQPTDVQMKHRAKDWSQSHRYFCWNYEGTGFWSDSYVPGPAFLCVGPYSRRPEPMTGEVTAVDPRAKTLTVVIQRKAVTLSARNLKSLPKAGEMINMGGDDPTGQRLVCWVTECDMGWGSGPCIRCFDYQRLRMSGKVTQVEDAAKTFTVMAIDKAVIFHAFRLNALPKVGEIIDITYTQLPDGSMEATRMTPCPAECVRRQGGCICP